MSGAKFTTHTSETVKRVAEMQPFEMWSRELIGATPEDYEAAANGTLSPERHEKLAAEGIAARERLSQMPVSYVQDWMPYRRICN